MGHRRFEIVARSAKGEELPGRLRRLDRLHQRTIALRDHLPPSVGEVLALPPHGAGLVDQKAEMQVEKARVRFGDWALFA
jgi:hypothetical protein